MPEPYYQLQTDGGLTIGIALTPGENRIVGDDAATLMEPIGSILDALILARSAQAADPATWADIIAALERHTTTVGGITAAAVRAHAAAGGTYTDLAAAMGVARSTAQTRRQAITSTPPGPAEQWATGGR